MEADPILVLVVTRDAALRQHLRHTLSEAGHAAVHVDDGLRAVAWLEAGLDPRVILIDARRDVPQPTRFIPTLRIHARVSGVQLVMLTATPDELTATYARILTMPFAEEALLGIVRQCA